LDALDAHEFGSPYGNKHDPGIVGCMEKWRPQMETREETNSDSMKQKDHDDYYLKVWKHYEDVAMHFNDLIIKLRTQSIGGLAGLAAILGIFLHTQGGDNESFNCGLAIVATICLMLLWIAVWILDMRYYNRLLEGSVNAILELEKGKDAFQDKKEISLSSNIEGAFRRRFPHEPRGWYKRGINGRNGFYAMVLIALLLILVASVVTYCSSCKEHGLAARASQTFRLYPETRMGKVGDVSGSREIGNVHVVPGAR
jgi:hypothetical protein